MRNIFRTLINMALIVGGFFIVFFGVQKATSHGANKQPTLSNLDSINVAHADVPTGGPGGGPSDSGGDSASDSAASGGDSGCSGK